MVLVAVLPVFSVLRRFDARLEGYIGIDVEVVGFGKLWVGEALDMPPRLADPEETRVESVFESETTIVAADVVERRLAVSLPVLCGRNGPNAT